MLAYYVDDTTYSTVPNPGNDFAQKPFYWILNTAIGGCTCKRRSRWRA